MGKDAASLFQTLPLIPRAGPWAVDESSVSSRLRDVHDGSAGDVDTQVCAPASDADLVRAARDREYARSFPDKASVDVNASA